MRESGHAREPGLEPLVCNRLTLTHESWLPAMTSARVSASSLCAAVAIVTAMCVPQFTLASRQNLAQAVWKCALETGHVNGPGGAFIAYYAEIETVCQGPDLMA